MGQWSGVYLGGPGHDMRRLSLSLGSKMGWLIALTLHLCATTAFGQDFYVSKRCCL